MIKDILNSQTCKECRVCCGFDESDKWEIPLIYSENRSEIESKLGAALVPRGNEYVFDMEFDGEKVVYCPALGENGCMLGELKPFDCSIWPFRVNKLGNLRVITLSPVCHSVSDLPLNVLSEFVNRKGFAEKLFSEADKHPDMVKPYIDGYPILAVEHKSNE